MGARESVSPAPPPPAPILRARLIMLRGIIVSQGLMVVAILDLDPIKNNVLLGPYCDLTTLILTQVSPMQYAPIESSTLLRSDIFLVSYVILKSF